MKILKNTPFRKLCVLYTVVLVTIYLFVLPVSAQLADRQVTIHLRGVYDANIIVMSTHNKSRNFLPIMEQPGVRGGTTTTLTIPAKELPGQFTFQFKYRLKETDYPYPAERTIFIYRQDIELWISPVYGSNPDSTWFAKEELENTTYEKFMKENSTRRQKVDLLQMFLMQYDEQGSKFYKKGEKEYGKRRSAYNLWIAETASVHSELYVSRLFQFKHIPPIAFTGTEKERMLNMIGNYFEGINLNDSLLAGTKDFNDWITSYVNLNAGMYTTQEESDTMLVKAAQRIIEQGKQYGHPKVYGFMVDYFYTGFETYDMLNGITMLEPYASDPNCMTTKRIEIERRLAGMAALKIGVKVPEIIANDAGGNPFSLYDYRGNAPRKLLVFWSADCDHCMELIVKVKEWYDQPGNAGKVNVIAISMDETDVEVAKWQETIKGLPNWTHLRPKGGINSKEAYDYAILATPYMYLISADKNTIIGIPNNVQELQEMMAESF